MASLKGILNAYRVGKQIALLEQKMEQSCGGHIQLIGNPVTRRELHQQRAGWLETLRSYANGLKGIEAGIYTLSYSLHENFED